MDLVERRRVRQGEDMRDTYTQWESTRIQAQLWWCGDEDCDCTQPVIERITPNREAGYPWIRRENLWEGKFLTETCSYSLEERERLHFAPLREACAQFGVPVPELPGA